MCWGLSSWGGEVSLAGWERRVGQGGLCPPTKVEGLYSPLGDLFFLVQMPPSILTPPTLCSPTQKSPGRHRQ